jgi:glycosyltransferase involved in cell wall biosynthesis
MRAMDVAETAQARHGGYPARQGSYRSHREPFVSVLIPALSEERNIGWVLDGLDGCVDEVILIVADPEDRTIEVAQRHRPDVKVVMQTRAGKGNALLCGFAAAAGDILVTLDADGSTDPREIPRFIEALLSGADYAKGSRFVGEGGSTDFTALRRCGNRLLTMLVNGLYGTRYTDLCYGFNAFWSDVVATLELDPGDGIGRRQRGDGFEVEAVMNLRAALAGLAVAEVASFEGSRRSGVSHLSVLSDGWRVLSTISIEHRSWRRRTKAALARAG